MADNDNSGAYKFIVLVGVALFVMWLFASLQDAVSSFSGVLGFIIGPILMYFVYRIVKGIF